MTSASSSTAVRALPEQIEVAIVGSGFAGLAMAAELKRSGVEDFLVLERSRDVGGTWRYTSRSIRLNGRSGRGMIHGAVRWKTCSLEIRGWIWGTN